jgi:hypothetical protein
MKIKQKRNILITGFLLVAAGIGIFFLYQKTNIVETIKKETDKLLEYEYIHNKKVDIETR